MKNRAFLCLGYPATGKSTFFRNNGLQTITLSADSIAETIPYTIGGEMRIQYSPNWAQFRDWMLNDWVTKHADVIIDQPCYRERTMEVVYKRLLMAGYENYFIDFTVKENGEPWTMEELIENNSKRQNEANILGNFLGLCMKKDFDYIRGLIYANGDSIITRDEFLDMIHKDLEFVDLNNYEHVVVTTSQSEFENKPENFYIVFDNPNLLNKGIEVAPNVINIIGANVLNATLTESTDIRKVFDTYFAFTFKGRKYIVSYQIRPIIPSVLNKLPWLDEREHRYDYRRLVGAFTQNYPDITYIHADRRDVFMSYDNVISLFNEDNEEEEVIL